MKIAMPVTGGRLSQHFGHCEQFLIFEVEDRALSSREDLSSPPHEPGLLPRWLKEQGVTMVIAGGMGNRALQLFQQAGIEVIYGAPSVEPEAAVDSYLKGDLQTGDNACDH